MENKNTKCERNKAHITSAAEVWKACM